MSDLLKVWAVAVWDGDLSQVERVLAWIFDSAVERGGLTDDEKRALYTLALNGKLKWKWSWIVKYLRQLPLEDQVAVIGIFAQCSPGIQAAEWVLRNFEIEWLADEVGSDVLAPFLTKPNTHQRK